MKRETIPLISPWPLVGSFSLLLGAAGYEAMSPPEPPRIPGPLATGPQAFLLVAFIATFYLMLRTSGYRVLRINLGLAFCLLAAITAWPIINASQGAQIGATGSSETKSFSAGVVSDPVKDYTNEKHLVATDSLYQWSAHVGEQGRSAVFLCLKTEHDEDVLDWHTPSWIVYFSTLDHTGFVASKGTDDSGDGPSPVLTQVDPESMFLGRITQLSKRGIVTSQTDYPKKAEPVRYIYALTLEGDFFKQTLLAKYNPDQANAIYDQYLSPAHRTKVQLRTVTP